MKTVVNHETYGEITFEESFWSGQKQIFFNGTPLVKLSKTTFQTADGEKVTVTGNYLKGSKMQIGSETVTLTPSVKWYEIVLSVLPFILIMVWGNSVALCSIVPVVGGAIGGLISAVFCVLNLLIIKGLKQIWLKILVSIVCLGVVFLICFGIGTAIVTALSTIA